MKNYRIIISWLLVILWMGLIFNLSHKPASESNKMSKGISQTIVETIEKVAPNSDIDKSIFNNLLRKVAHFLAYLVLGVLLANSLKNNGISGYKGVVSAIFICVLYAISDEVHQLFVPGRGGQIKDVIIDSAGGLVGILSFEVTQLNRKQNNMGEKK